MTSHEPEITGRIRACRLCAADFALTVTRHEPRPVVWFRTGARILIVGQAPGLRVHESGVPFDLPFHLLEISSGAAPWRGRGQTAPVAAPWAALTQFNRDSSKAAQRDRAKVGAAPTNRKSKADQLVGLYGAEGTQG